MSEFKRVRIDYVDLFRGIGIILMVMGHIGFGDIFDKFIHAFHMPMFFFISGYFYNTPQSNILYVVKKKAKALLIPYLNFAVFYYLIYFITKYFITNKDPSIGIFKSFVFNSVNTIPIGGALWFLTALFFTDLIYILLDKIFSKTALLDIIIIIRSIS